jgi:hypothetical protein
MVWKGRERDKERKERRHRCMLFERRERRIEREIMVYE